MSYIIDRSAVSISIGSGIKSLMRSCPSDSSSSNESQDHSEKQSKHCTEVPVLFPRENTRAVIAKEIGVKFIVQDSLSAPTCTP